MQRGGEEKETEIETGIQLGIETGTEPEIEEKGAHHRNVSFTERNEVEV